MKLYFRDNFFSAGQTDILNEQQEDAGMLDLKDAFGSSIDVYGPGRSLMYSGAFRTFSNKWRIRDARGHEAGVLRSRFAFFTKKYTYETLDGGSYSITSPAFSKAYEVFNASGQCVAKFAKVNGWFASGAFELDNQSEELNDYELACVIMGMHNIQKRQQAASNHAAH